jgi:hypothetical protein
MLAQLWDDWSRTTAGQWNLQKLDFELSVWMSQHCLDADDFAFDLACSLRAFVAEAIEQVH